LTWRWRRRRLPLTLGRCISDWIVVSLSFCRGGPPIPVGGTLWHVQSTAVFALSPLRLTKLHAGSLALCVCLSLCQRARDRRCLLVSLPAACRAKFSSSFFLRELFGAIFFVCVFSLERAKRRDSSQISASPLPKSPFSPPACASKPSRTFTRVYIKTKNGQGKFLSSLLSRDERTSLLWVRASEQNTKREREWRIKYRASRVSSLFRSRARADFLFSFSRGELPLWDFSFRKTARERWMRTSLARLDDSNVLIYRSWMYSDRICAFSLVSSVSFGEMHFSFFPSRCRFRFADRAFIGSADFRFTFAALVSTQSRSFTIIKFANVLFFPFYASISTERSKESQIWDPVLLPGG